MKITVPSLEQIMSLAALAFIAAATAKMLGFNVPIVKGSASDLAIVGAAIAIIFRPAQK